MEIKLSENMSSGLFLLGLHEIWLTRFFPEPKVVLPRSWHYNKFPTFPSSHLPENLVSILHLTLSIYFSFVINYEILLIFLLEVPVENRQHHGQSIHLTEKFTSMNVFKIIFVVTWAQHLLISMVMEAVRSQKRYSTVS
jgi:hypothetical protein